MVRILLPLTLTLTLISLTLFCISCGTYIQRSEGCKYMTCTQCQSYFCWDCKRFLQRDHENHLCVQVAQQPPPNLTPAERMAWQARAERYYRHAACGCVVSSASLTSHARRRKRVAKVLQAVDAANRGLGQVGRALGNFQRLRRVARLLTGVAATARGMDTIGM